MKEKKTFFKIDDAHHNWNNFDLWSKQSYPGSTHLKTVLCLLNVSGEFCPRNVWICWQRFDCFRINVQITNRRLPDIVTCQCTPSESNAVAGTDDNHTLCTRVEILERRCLRRATIWNASMRYNDRFRVSAFGGFCLVQIPPELKEKDKTKGENETCDKYRFCEFIPYARIPGTGVSCLACVHFFFEGKDIKQTTPKIFFNYFIFILCLQLWNEEEKKLIFVDCLLSVQISREVFFDTFNHSVNFLKMKNEKKMKKFINKQINKQIDNWIKRGKIRWVK